LNFNLWIDSLTKPVATFKKERKNANLSQGALHIAVAGIVTGFLSGLYQMLFFSPAVGSIFPMASGFAGVAGFLMTLILTPIFSVIAWLIISGILYILALIFGGKGSYTTQSYLYAIYSAPLSIVTTIIALIPFYGMFLSIIPALYGLYLLTMALKEAHKYSTVRAFFTWFIPILIVVVIAVIIGVAILAFLLGGMAGNLGGTVSGM